MTKKILSALPLGGVGEIGMNMMVYECDGDLVVVDAGVSFADESVPGVDVIVPDTRYLREHIKHIKGLIITHAHEDHIGAVGYLWDDFGGAKVYCSPFTRLVLEGKLTELGIKPAKGQIVTIKPRETYQMGKFTAEFVQVAHSVPEGFAVALRSPYGTIVHTGDYKFDENPPFGHKTDEQRFKEIGDEGVLALFGDSTNVFRKTASGSEGDIIPTLEGYIKDAKNRVFFAAFASNIGRVLQVAEIASKNGRKVCFLGRTVNKMLGHAKTLGYFPGGLSNWIVEAEEIRGLPRNKVLVFASGTQGEPQASLTRLSQGNDVRGIKMEAGDTVIMSSKMIPGNERPILNVINNLYHRGAKVLSEITHNDIHVSGHGGQPEIQRMYKAVRPKYVVPVHGEAAHLQRQAEFARENGLTPLSIADGRKLVLFSAEEGFKPHLQQHAYPHGLNYIDGLNILENDPFILKERRKLAFEGLVTAALAIRQSNGEWVSEVSLTSRGLLDERVQATSLQAATRQVTQALEAGFPDGLIQDRTKAVELITQSLRRTFKQERGKQPTIVVQLVEV